LVLFDCRADDRLDLPEKEAQVQSYAKVSNVFKNELKAAKNAAEQSALAKQLLKVASETNDDPTTRFAILQLAVETAKKAGDLDLVFSSIDEIAKKYEVDVLDSKLEAFSNFSAPITAENLRKIQLTITKLVAQSIVSDRFDTAKGLGVRMETIAKKLRNPIFRTEIEAQQVIVEKLARAHARSLDAARKLENLDKDEDEVSAANLMIGRYHIGIGDWPIALPFVSYSSDFHYAKLANSELSGEKTFAGRLSIADGWWDLAEKEDLLVKRQLELHAAEIYKTLVGEATGFVKKQVEFRIAKISMNIGSSLEEFLAAESKHRNDSKIAEAARAAALAGDANPDKLKQPAVNIKVINARWGGGQNWADVTKRVQELVDTRALVWASPDVLKSDPTPYWKKKLQIEYEIDGKRLSAWIEEDRAWETETHRKKN
jgi:hypothetical protein